jgi:hypothetical protein
MKLQEFVACPFSRMSYDDKELIPLACSDVACNLFSVAAHENFVDNVDRRCRALSIAQEGPDQ